MVLLDLLTTSTFNLEKLRNLGGEAHPLSLMLRSSPDPSNTYSKSAFINNIQYQQFLAYIKAFETIASPSLGFPEPVAGIIARYVGYDLSIAGIPPAETEGDNLGVTDPINATDPIDAATEQANVVWNFYASYPHACNAIIAALIIAALATSIALSLGASAPLIAINACSAAFFAGSIAWTASKYHANGFEGVSAGM